MSFENHVLSTVLVYVGQNQFDHIYTLPYHSMPHPECSSQDTSIDYWVNEMTFDVVY
jgi:hypothetical protein